jgi:dienelactone hydrolase
MRAQAADVTIPPFGLGGSYARPEPGAGVVVFVHGSGSSRFSPRNRYVAGMLQQGGLATLLIDLLTPAEEEVDDVTRELRFDIGMLAGRLIEAIEWAANQPHTGALDIGLFGASTGAGAALLAAAQRPELIRAVVSRGGRPDLAGPALPRVDAPTLLIVGARDTPVIELNRKAFDELCCVKRMDVVPRASHLFEEPGTLDEVARLARDWFVQRLGGRR